MLKIGRLVDCPVWHGEVLFGRAKEYTEVTRGALPLRIPFVFKMIHFIFLQRLIGKVQCFGTKSLESLSDLFRELHYIN